MKDFQKVSLTIAVAGALAFGCGGAAAVPVYGSNLIVNGDAETGAGSDGFSTTQVIAGFTSTGPLNEVQYGLLGGGLETGANASPGLSGHPGNNYFAGGPDNALSSISQFISLAGIETAIDGGQVSFVLSAYLGGYQSQNDNMVLTAVFLDFDGATTDTFSLGPIGAGRRENATGLVEQELAFTIPTLSRGVQVTLTSTRTDGSYNDGYADDLSLVLQGPADSPPPPPPAPPGNVVPEPDMAALLALGGLGIVAARRRRATSK